MLQVMAVCACRYMQGKRARTFAQTTRRARYVRELRAGMASANANARWGSLRRAWRLMMLLSARNLLLSLQAGIPLRKEKITLQTLMS